MKITEEEILAADIPSDRIVIERSEAPEKHGELIEAVNLDPAKVPARGRVVALGKGVGLKKGGYAPYRLDLGDFVAFNRNVGQEFKTSQGKRFLFLKEEHVYLRLALPDEAHDRDAAYWVDMLNDFILIEDFGAPAASSGGILLPNAKREYRGKVIAVGPGAWSADGSRRLPMSVTPGEIVRFEQYAGTAITLNGKEYLVVHDNEILAVEEGA